ncbi:MAG: hypothetical protein ACTHKL_15245 [Streptosporangiaceae bacterium]
MAAPAALVSSAFQVCPGRRGVASGEVETSCGQTPARSVVVQEMLGRSDIRVTRGYTHLLSLLAHDVAAKLGRALFGELLRNCYEEP